MAKYKFTLKPLTPYFFGDNKTFGEQSYSKDLKNPYEDITNYNVNSLKLPQQTTILGFLRYEVLKACKLLGRNYSPSDWNSAIGDSSFSLNGKNKFGFIKTVSPVFISNGKEHYTPAAHNFVYTRNNIKEIDAKKTIHPINIGINLGTISKTITNKAKLLNTTTFTNYTAIANEKSYSPKDGHPDLFVESKGNKMLHGVANKEWDSIKFLSTEGILSKDGLILEHKRIGNKKNIKKRSDDAGDFFIQTSYSLRENFAFTFIAEIELPEGSNFSNGIVKMGGEQSVFKLQVEEDHTIKYENIFTETTFSSCFERNIKCIVLLSEAIISINLFNDLEFSTCDFVPFNNIYSNTNNSKNYAVINHDRKKMKHATLLLKRGSVLYPKDCSKFIKQALEEDQNNYSKIGFNQFIIC